MNIFILEDDVYQQERILSTVKDILDEEQVSYRRLDVFSKPQSLLDAITERGNHNLFFLDIDIKGEEKRGLEVASEIRQSDQSAIIIFVTTHSEFAPISFKYKASALDFIDKALSQDDFKKQIRENILYTVDLTDSQSEDEVFTYSSAKARVQLPFRDILYFETATTAHKIALRTKTERLEFYAKMSEIASMSPKLFQCHRSYLINLDNVVRVDRSQLMVFFENGESCIVSRLKMKALLNQLEK
ncbi:response regulator transcription factor [Streptococcus loxodontisalivarius]|uniref:Two-component system response regulator AgrA n=1 Tax=Streptococcus loxodontisalivarius TaxID=1349415 RepID=A0ABS2PU20_9STRE|nr:response regulator transcription factor [Streptococcus loxodontisalivarius]MBM7642847.1 two-component system response regulator AgrA [Streptococcus loxodontisalivarius]